MNIYKIIADSIKEEIEAAVEEAIEFQLEDIISTTVSHMDFSSRIDVEDYITDEQTEKIEEIAASLFDDAVHEKVVEAIDNELMN